MLTKDFYDNNNKVQLFRQIACSIEKRIDNGLIKRNSWLPSINNFSDQLSVSRDTVEKAYNELKKLGYISSHAGKGYYVESKKGTTIKILMVFNKISSFKNIIYYSFLNKLGSSAVVDLQVHHYNPRKLKYIIEANIGKYDYYVIMPHFETNINKNRYLPILKKIPAGKLLLLDKSVPELKDIMSVHQDFKFDIYDALIYASDLIEKYHTLAIIFPEYSHHPPEIIEGLMMYCSKYHKNFSRIANGGEGIKLTLGTVYIVIADDDLAILVKKIRMSNYQMGKEIGVISFNETELKELLDITVISTDFEKMGNAAAELILKKEIKQIKNSCKIIKRGSL